MRAAYNAEQITAAETPVLDALPEGALMQRAAAALARRCAALLGRVYGSRVVVLAGSGNNGGDALYAAAHLARRGARVDALLTAGRVHAQAESAFCAAGGEVRPADSAAARSLLARADLVIDGIIGIGGKGGLRDVAAAVVDAMSDSDAVVVAVDVPSGVDASTGEVAGAAVHADVTVTFGGAKTGLVIAPGAALAGAVDVVDIGLALPRPDVTLLDADDVASLVPQAMGDTDKYRRGVVGVAAGSDTYTGAAVLAVGGALAAGAGMVRYAGTARAAELVRQRWPEAVVTVVDPGDGEGVLEAGRVQAWVVGSGSGTDEPAASLIEAVLGTDVPVLVDADALTVIARHPEWVRRRSAPTVLTPHAGEFARLLAVGRDEVEARRLTLVRQAAADLGATVLLKGSTTLVAAPDGAVRVNSTGTAYLATAGSGDVLSGVCGAMLAGGLDALDAASVGAFLHGLAGLLAVSEPAAPVTAMDLVDALPAAIRTVRR